MKCFWIILGILTLTGGSVCSQNIEVNNLDCDDAYQLSDTASGPFVPKRGTGEIIEVTKKGGDDAHYFDDEKNTAWYYFVMPFRGDFAFEIDPVNSSSDIDFLLFMASDNDICEEIVKKEIEPIRSNLARVDLNNHGKTGLMVGAPNLFVGPGPKTNYSATVDAHRGDEFYLVINNLSDTGLAHRIYLHLTPTSKPIMMPTTGVFTHEKPANHNEKLEPGISMTIDVQDASENRPVKATISIDGIVPGKALIVEDTEHFTYILEKRKEYTVKCVNRGYMIYTESFTSPEESDKMKLTVVMQPIKEGAKVTLDNINFKPDGAHILRSSEPELTSLVKFMEKNPTISIQINGHVNAPGEKNTAAAQKMSKMRAKAVYSYLVEQGVNKSRLKYKGFGNSEMIYPKPTSHVEERSNRRVEIEITKK